MDNSNSSNGKFEHFIEANCQTIEEMIWLKGLSVNTFTLLYNHFVSQEIVADTPDIDCMPGCGYCCHLRVSASVAEILVILNFLQCNEQIEYYREQIKSGSEQFLHDEKRTPDWWVKNAVRCLFFDEERKLCRIYEVRPFSCRGYHSLDVHQCEKGYSHRILCPIPCYPDIKRSQELYSQSFEIVMGQLGKQSSQFELTSSISLFLLKPDLVDQWFAGEYVLA